MASRTAPKFGFKQYVLLSMAIYGLAFSACTKRCQLGLTLADGKCVRSNSSSQLADGGADDMADSEIKERNAAEVDAGAGQPPARSGDSGRPKSNGAAASASPGAAGSSGADTGPSSAGMVASAPGSVCGDGIVQGQELCDPASASMPCPTECEEDTNPCNQAMLSGNSSSCTAECTQTAILAQVAGDECCPAGATPATDADCAAACTNTSEVCDGRDNDCDGEADEGVRNACGGCTTLRQEPRATCSEGTGECQASGVYECEGTDAVSCNAVMRPEEPEACDSKDNDCDGRIDETVLNSCGGCADLDHDRGAACTAGSAACEVRGVYLCMGTDAVACDARARTPSVEACDGEDNDCDGSVDEGAGRTWYQDCDGDGYPAQGAGRDACSEPPTMNGCHWIDRAPSSSATDCDDRNEVRHPGANPGLPISQPGQTLPPANDPAYDLNCDGVLTRSGGGFATGQLKQGQLELLDLCPETFMCSGGGPYCILPFGIQGGGAVCGQPYRTEAPCTGEIDVYIQCQ